MSGLAGMASTLASYGPSDASTIAAAAGGGGSKTARMRRALTHGPKTANELRAAAGLEHTGLVYALLKGDVKTSRILLRDGRYILNPAWTESLDESVQKAISLLTKNGFRVERQDQ